MSVLQPWLSGCSWKEQTVVLCALRGPDAGCSPEVKQWTRWVRSVALKNADPEHPFMRVDAPGRIRDVENARLDALPVHYFSHLMHALQVIGYHHDDGVVASTALQGYEDMCEFLHVGVEHYAQMHVRLRDRAREDAA